MTITLGTANAAKLFLAIAATAQSPTVSQPSAQLLQQVRSPQKTSCSSTIAPTNIHTSTSMASEGVFDNLTRATTVQEKLIGEIRSWGSLSDDWDGEGGLKPVTQSLKDAASFVTLLSSEIILPEPMLLSSGHAALFWNEAGLYSDIEFLGDGRIAYFIKKNGDKHKGVLEFDAQQMPAVFPALLRC
jgi:hypothetical protein